MNKGIVGLSLKMIIPLILGLIIVFVYMVIFGPQALVALMNQSFNVSINPTP